MAKRRTNIPVTHAVQERRGLPWMTVHEGSEADCASVLRLVKKHWPDKEYRMLTASEARADRRRKTWSVHDDDHIPPGSPVLIRDVDDADTANCRRMAIAFGIETQSLERRRGTVGRRDRRTGHYMVHIVDSNWSLSVPRSALIYPVPENVIPFERVARRRRTS